MSSKTKIIVLHMKEIIYTAIFLILAILLGILLFIMFFSGKKQANEAPDKYKAGVYNSSIALNHNTFDIEVTVDADKIKAINLTNLSETTAAAFPLMKPSLELIVTQIYATQSLDNIQYSSDRKHTSLLLLQAIEEALEKACVP